MTKPHRLVSLFLTVTLAISGCSSIDTQALRQTAQPTQNQSTEPASPASSPTADELRFDGVVNAHDVNELGDIKINGSIYTLDLIEPVSDYCVTDNAAYEAALQMKRDLLPIGQRVFVVIGQEPSQVFIHLSQYASPTPDTEPPALSANEMLVRSGFWVLDSYAFTSFDDARGAEIERVDYAELTPIEEEYAPFLLDAANDAIRQVHGAFAVCSGDEFQSSFYYAISTAVSTREQEIWDRNNSGGGWYWGGRDCDGDNDGICGE